MSKRVRTIEEIREAYMAKEFDSKLPFFFRKDKLKEDHVFDEDKSVKWNREKVEKYNADIDQKMKDRKADENRLSEALREEIIQALQDYYDLNRKQAEKIQSYVYSEYHSTMSDYFIYLDEIANLSKDIIEMRDE